MGTYPTTVFHALQFGCRLKSFAYDCNVTYSIRIDCFQIQTFFVKGLLLKEFRNPIKFFVYNIVKDVEIFSNLNINCLRPKKLKVEKKTCLKIYLQLIVMYGNRYLSTFQIYIFCNHMFCQKISITWHCQCLNSKTKVSLNGADIRYISGLIRVLAASLELLIQYSCHARLLYTKPHYAQIK